MEKIHVSLFGGKNFLGGRETPLEADIIYCDKAASCSFYKNGNCLRCRSLSPSCKYGRNEIVKGYTSKAQKYYDFKKKYLKDEKYDKLKYPRSLVGKIDDVFFFNFMYVLVRQATEKDDPWSKTVNGYIIKNAYFGIGNFLFIPSNCVTNEFLYNVFSFKPTSMIGDEISDYREKIVPEILQELKFLSPEIYEKFIFEHPDYIYEPNYIGKRAYIYSLKKGTKFQIGSVTWIYDGEYVETENCNIGLSSPWFLQDVSYGFVKIKVNDKMTIEVKDNSIVDKDTKFE